MIATMATGDWKTPEEEEAEDDEEETEAEEPTPRD